ncbi:MAG: response regulator transcription factor [Lachnospiraceae bacterium]|nr:response regulator transcription factor [Lachnospiraceae bacterium]
MLKLAICDDDPLDLKKTVTLIQQWQFRPNLPEIRIRSFHSPYQLLDCTAQGEEFDIFLLDILMPEMTGITLGEQLLDRYCDPLIIYLSTSRDYYSEAFGVYAFNYLCKPISQNSLFPVLDKIARRYEKRRDHVFLLKTSEGLLPIPFHTIVYAELLAHVCHFHLSDGRVVKSQYLRLGFHQFLAPLLEQENFIKTHTSFVVNLAFSSSLTNSTLALTEGSMVPVSRSFCAQVQREYMNYWFRDREWL